MSAIVPDSALRRVAAGESLQITDRGRPVARLVPPGEDSWEQMVASGEIVPPELTGDILDDPPLPGVGSASARLTATREHER